MVSWFLCTLKFSVRKGYIFWQLKTKLTFTFICDVSYLCLNKNVRRVGFNFNLLVCLGLSNFIWNRFILMAFSYVNFF